MANTFLAQLVDQIKKVTEHEHAVQERQRASPLELELAWQVLCPNGDSLTPYETEELLQQFHPHLTPKQLKDMARDGMSFDMLQHLLIEQPLQGVDASIAGFRVLDPDTTGVAGLGRLMALMKRLHGVEQLDESEMVALMQLADLNSDGKITQEDFNQFCRKQQAMSLSGAKAQRQAAQATVQQ